RRLDEGHQEGAPRRAPAPGRHGVDQHLQRLRHGRAVRRLQAERVRPRNEHARARALHAGEERLGGPESVGAGGGPTRKPWRIHPRACGMTMATVSAIITPTVIHDTTLYHFELI